MENEKTPWYVKLTWPLMCLVVYGCFFFCCTGIVSCDRAETEARYKASYEYHDSFLAPSDYIVDVKEEHAAFEVNNKGHRSGSYLVFVVESPVTKERRIYSDLYFKDGKVPISGERWRMVLEKGSLRYNVYFKEKINE